MTGQVIPLPPREFYAVVPGAGGQPGLGEPEPVFYARTLDGMISALEHAKLLSANGSGPQDVTLTQGRQTRVIMRFENGRDISRRLLPGPYKTQVTPDPENVRDGAPNGHIRELCSTAKHRARGTKPRRSPHMPRQATWPGLDVS